MNMAIKMTFVDSWGICMHVFSSESWVSGFLVDEKTFVVTFYAKQNVTNLISVLFEWLIKVNLKQKNWI